ncbi:MAG: hypothetical protein AAF282_23795 [Cyanobacteria bacterium P01_A01_bin.15]
MLRISKTTHLCHQNISLKKIRHHETVTYISAISHKLGKIWQQPVGKIASTLITVLEQQATQPVWATIRSDDRGWLEFGISQSGIERWRQQLLGWELASSEQGSPWPISADTLWQLQSGYELCCRWQAIQGEMSQANATQTCIEAGLAPFQVAAPLQNLVHCLLDICDYWDSASPTQRLRQARQLVLALEACVSVTRPVSPAAKDLSRWIEPACVVLEQLICGQFGHSIAERF